MLRKISSIYRVNGWYQNAVSQNMQIADYKPDLATKKSKCKQTADKSKQTTDKSKQIADKK